MLQRPIIVFSEDVIRNKYGEAISINDLLGIYLPILCSSSECVREPIVLAYDQSHFCPLQMSDEEYRISPTTKRKYELENLIPLYQSIDEAHRQNLLPVHFLKNDIAPEQTKQLLHDYLQVKTIYLRKDRTLMDIPIDCAQLGTTNLEPRKNFFMLYQRYMVDFYETRKKEMQMKTVAEEREEKQKQQHRSTSIQRSPRIDPSASPRTQTTIPSSSHSDTIKEPSSKNTTNPAVNLVFEHKSSDNSSMTNVGLLLINSSSLAV
ncbi:unnamed protein product [Rotaria sp. Silwood2]|nr:unnamed protein product [Rotaria sp. Silwood2]CAF2678296.1 unnamed protein product [Rotaria sp. Silwood2]CAF4304329.1 unnamed protein product [Rotaria sp. Silwood2]CAF4476235.1 unnamed protein product [Rotaria sp. Silwood2]